MLMKTGILYSFILYDLFSRLWYIATCGPFCKDATHISKFTENCSADKMSHSWPSIYYHIFGIDMVSARNRVEGQDIRKYCSKHHFFRLDVHHVLGN